VVINLIIYVLINSFNKKSGVNNIVPTSAIRQHSTNASNRQTGEELRILPRQTVELSTRVRFIELTVLYLASGNITKALF